MGCRLLWLTLLALLAGCFGQPCTLITPSVLHLESEETIVVDGHNKAFEAIIVIQNFPKRHVTLVMEKISLNSGNQFLGTAKVTIPSTHLAEDPKGKQYVYVTVKSPVCNIEKVVLLGHESGYIFIQTDKTIYTPGSTVLFRVFSMNYKMSSVNKAVTIEFSTPENKIVKRSLGYISHSGMLSLSYRLPILVSLGVWTISAKYEDSPLHSYSAHFEVKEYVLPTCEIQLIPTKRYFLVDDPEFVVNIKAKYFYGKPVSGMGFVIFGVKKADMRTSLPDTQSRIVIESGEGVAVLRRQDLMKIFRTVDEMLQYSLYISVTVITDSGGEIVETELEDVHIVKSPFKVLFNKATKYFKPGMPFDLMVFVTNPDGSPASQVPVVAEPGKVMGITGAEGTVRLTLNTAANIKTLQITVRTTHPTLPGAQQATASMTAHAYQSGGDYLHIAVTAAKVKPGENLAVNFILRNTNVAIQNQIQHVTYLIMAKGRILAAGRQPRQQGQTSVTMSLPITEEFAPSFRIVGYYIADNEIVSDSIWMEVTDTCLGTLSVTGNTDKDNKVQGPGSFLRLKLQADHRANVGLVAVDKRVNGLNSKYKISQKMVWESLETSDLGCSPGSGADSMGVFYDAGLALQSSLQTTTQQRTELQCKVHGARRRRFSAQLIEETTTDASKHKELVKRCCTRGMHENPMGDSCEKQAENIVESKECVEVFLDCCKYTELKRKEKRSLKEQDEDSRTLQYEARTARRRRSIYDEDDDEYLTDDLIISRRDFPESWFWKEERMGDRSDNKGISTKVLNVFLKDSITTWEFLAVSFSETKGICVSKPYDVQVMRDIFIDLKLPYSVVRNKQVEIRAVVYNYGNFKIKVRVELAHNPNFCSLSPARKKFRQFVAIKPQSSVAVPFIIVPLNLGYHDVEVTVAVSGQEEADGVRKTLKVVPEGVYSIRNMTGVTLDPQVNGDGVQVEVLSPLNDNNIKPVAGVETIVNIKGNPDGAPVEDAVDGTNFSPLIIVPRGNGEENMITMAPNVITTIYLDATNQWEKIGVTRRTEALNNIKKGYTQQLVYRKSDNSYAASKDRSSSTWLTTYVAKVFAMGQGLVEIDTNVLCESIKWLILEKQNADGRYKEDAPVLRQELVGGIKGSSDDVALTAFVLIAMLESEKICSPHVNSLRFSIEKATSFLQSHYQGLVKPYTIAITSYALAMAGAINNPDKLLSGATGRDHWKELGDNFMTIEATSYALLALLRLKQYDLTGPIVNWINEQKYYGAVYGSTQATFVMFQALAEYEMDKISMNDINLDVSLSFKDSEYPLSFRINQGNAMQTYVAQTNVNADFVVKAAGKGKVTLTGVSVYYAPLIDNENECNNFDLSVTATEDANARTSEGVWTTISVEICTRHLKDNDATMSILDISMMTGFIPDIESLNKLKRGQDKYVSKFEINKEPKDRNSLLIYLDKILHRQEECIKFNVHQIYKVGVIQPASVTVYEYNSPENRCTKFYHMDKDSKMLATICQDGVCRCAAENCFLKQHLDDVIDAEGRFFKACATRVDYVYKAHLEELQKNDKYDIYVMKIILVLKAGKDENTLDTQKKFLSHIKCRKTLDLVKGRDYLIWGPEGELWNEPSGYTYIIGKDTWIEWWPNESDCQNPENKKRCDDLSDLSDSLLFTGCLT
ncbi:A.superbus venom factor 1-like [Leptodactylus fuscus]|uniref:A.superbus venom factor 1-like n=1 Tax=Leptodactylus fuscus TaxID=238119 RepID=UPI003F4F2B54